MTRHSQAGFVGILILVLVSVLTVGGIWYFVSHESPTHVVSVEPKTQNDQLALANFYAQVAANTAAESQTTVTDEKPATDSKPATKDSTKSSLSSYSGQEAPTQTKTETTVVPTQPKEPEITVPTLVIRPGTQPKSQLLLPYAARTPFTVLEFTAKGSDIEISKMVVERQGLAKDIVFTEVGVIDHDYERALNGNHQYTANDTFTIKKDETQEIILFGNMNDSDTLAEHDGEMPTLHLAKVESNAQIIDSQPFTETAHKVNSSLTIGSLEITNSSFDPGVARNIYINSNNVTFSAVRATAGSAEPVLLQWFAFTQTGSISDQDLANVKICADNKGTITCVDPDHSDGKYYFADFGDSLKIDKGESVDIYIKGDVLPSAVNRTIDFDIQFSYDILAYGLSYKNYFYSYGGEDEGAQPEGSFSTTESPFYNAYKHTVLGGTFNSISK